LTAKDLEGANRNNKDRHVPPIARVFAEFTVFLRMKVKTSKTTDKTGYYKPSMQAQYFGQVKEKLAEKFKESKLECFSDMEWYEETLHALKVWGRCLAISRGESIKDDTVGIHRNFLVHITDCLLREEESKWWERRFVLVALYHSVGRGGEVSVAMWNSVFWDDEQKISFVDW
jgi:hypothetical protein